MGYGRESRVRDILSDPAARSVAARYLPALTCSPTVEYMGFLPFSAILRAPSAAPPDPADIEAMWRELGQLEGVPRVRAEAPYVEPVPDYEPESVRRGSARVRPRRPAGTMGSDRAGYRRAVAREPVYRRRALRPVHRRRGGRGDGGGFLRRRRGVPGTVPGSPRAGRGRTSRPRPPARSTACGAPSRCGRPGPATTARWRSPIASTSPTGTARASRPSGRPATPGPTSARPCRSARWPPWPPRRSASSGCACSPSPTCSTPTSRPGTRSPVTAEGNWDFTRFDPGVLPSPGDAHRAAHRARHRDGPHLVPSV